MYYIVRIKEEDSWMQIFMCQFQGECNIRYFKMERLVMGNKPSASLSGVALSETAQLGDLPKKCPAALKALTTDAYVDNVFVTAPNHTTLREKIKEIEMVASKCGFFFKPFIVSGEELPDVVIGVSLPDAIAANEEKDTIVTHVRNDYWVIRCGKIATEIDSKCIDCKLCHKNFMGQVMGELPEFRSKMQPAFSTVGCDLWGPITIKDDVVKKGQRVTKKVWGVLFTCTTTRAIYLDVACGSTTE